MTLIVRYVEPGDYPDVANLHNERTNASNYVEAERMLRGDRQNAQSDKYFRRVIARADGDAAGTASIRSDWWGVVQPGRLWVELLTDSTRGDGKIDVLMLDHMEAGIGDEVHELATCMREDIAAEATFLRERGFLERFRSWGALLDLGTFEPAHFEPEDVRLEQEGFCFLPFNELPPGDNEAKLLDLKRDITRDIDAFEPIVPADSEDVLGDDYIQSGLIVALDQAGAFVGLASLRRPSSGGGVGCGLTGVRREHRHKGIATALKVRSLSVAKQLGATEVDTGGGGTDSTIRQINERLGFVVEPTWITYIRER